MLFIFNKKKIFQVITEMLSYLANNKLQKKSQKAT